MKWEGNVAAYGNYRFDSNGVQDMNSISEHRDAEKLRQARGGAINIAVLQAEMLQTHFVKTRTVSLQYWHRLIASLLKLGGHLQITPEDRSRLEQKLYNAGDNCSVNVEGNRIYIEGYFDINKLRQHILW